MDDVFCHTENTEFTELIKKFFSVFSVRSLVKLHCVPTEADTLGEPGT